MMKTQSTFVVNTIMFQLVGSPERKFTCYGLSMNNCKALTEYYIKAHELLYKSDKY